MSYHVWLSRGDSELKSSGPIWIQEGYFTGAVHSEKKDISCIRIIRCIFIYVTQVFLFVS